MRTDEEKNNQGVFISGATGSGKSRMTQRLAASWARVLYIDPMRTVRDIPQDGRVLRFNDAKQQLARSWHAPAFRIACSFSDDMEYRYLFHSLKALLDNRADHAPDFLLVVDEVDLWSSPGKINPALSHLLRYGRHFGMSWIANCRADTETHRDVRMNAQEVLVFRQGMISPELQRMIRSACRIRDIPRIEPGLLTKHDRSQPQLALEGAHFIALPDPWEEWYPSWLALASTPPPVA